MARWRCQQIFAIVFCFVFAVVINLICPSGAAQDLVTYDEVSDCATYSSDSEYDFYYNISKLRCEECSESRALQAISSDGKFQLTKCIASTRMLNAGRSRSSLSSEGQKRQQPDSKRPFCFTEAAQPEYWSLMSEESRSRSVSSPLVDVQRKPDQM